MVGRRISCCDSTELGCRRKAGETGSEVLVVFCKGELEQRDGEHVVKRINGRGAECAADAPDSVVLCDLEDLEQ